MSEKDPLVVSAIRGRVLSALANAASLWLAINGLIASYDRFAAGEQSPSLITEVTGHATVIMDSGTLIVMAILSVVGMASAAYSKWRERNRK